MQALNIAAARIAMLVATLGALACTDSLVPGELVVGIDITEEVSYGSENARLGAAVATDGESVLALAPGVESVWHDGELLDEGAFAVGFTVDRGAWTAGGGELRFLETGEAFTLRADDRIVVSDPVDGRVFASGSQGVWEPTAGQSRLTGTFQALALGGYALAMRVCTDGHCQIAWMDGSFVEVIPVSNVPYTVVPDLPALDGGALAWHNGELCAGNPEDDVDDGAGYVECVDPTDPEGEITRIEGMPGDHLGRAGSVAGGYAAGTFNKWIVPARTRIVPLGGGDVLALERGAEDQATTLAAAGDVLVIGQPYEMHDGMTAGAIHQVRP